MVLVKTHSKVISRNYRVSCPLWCYIQLPPQGLYMWRWRQEQQPQPQPALTHISGTSPTSLAALGLPGPPQHSAQSQQRVQRQFCFCRKLGIKPWHPGRSAYTWQWGVIAEGQRGHCPALLSTGRDLHFFTSKTQKWNSGDSERLCMSS